MTKFRDAINRRRSGESISFSDSELQNAFEGEDLLSITDFPTIDMIYRFLVLNGETIKIEPITALTILRISIQSDNKAFGMMDEYVKEGIVSALQDDPFFYKFEGNKKLFSDIADAFVVVDSSAENAFYRNLEI